MKPPSESLTLQYIQRVARGATSFEAAMALIGPEMHPSDAPGYQYAWENDPIIQHKIDQEKRDAETLRKNLREQVLNRLLAISLSDVRGYFQAHPDIPGSFGPKPITQWSNNEAQAVKKVKFREETDPFGNTTKTFDLEFYDPIKAIQVLTELFPDKFEDSLNDLNIIDDSIETINKLPLEDLQALHKKLMR